MTDIVETDGVLGGKPRVAGTRVSAEQIYEMHVLQELSPEEIADMLPTVDIDGVNAAITFMEERVSKEELRERSFGLGHSSVEV